MKTGTIKFNVTQRMRKHRGQDRNFDTKVLADMVNGPEVQERVKNRDLHGYLGHWPRQVFGPEPREGGIVDGKHVALEPAIVTTSLRAMMDGTVEHEAEFLDTATGRLAKRMHASKVGGFSSVIRCRELHGRDVPVSFHGFDYVNEPNFTTNRGYKLDGVFDADFVPEGVVLMDAALAEQSATFAVMDGLYSTLQADYDRVVEALANLAAERDELLAIATRGGVPEKDIMAHLADRGRAVFRLDGVGRRLPSSTLETIARQFETMDLPGHEAPPEPAEQGAVRKAAAQVQALVGAMGWRR